MEADLDLAGSAHIIDRVRNRRETTLPLVSAVIHGLVTPALLTSPLLLAAMGGEAIGLLPLELGVLGATFGWIFGWLDAPGRLAVALATRDDLLALLVMAVCSSAFLGFLWGGATGALAAGTVVLATESWGPDALVAIAMAMLFGSLVGGLFAAPGVTFYGIARALVVRRGAPWWLAPTSGILGSVGAVMMFALVYSLVAAIFGLILALGF